MFTPAQVCEMTNVASSTLRKYVAQFHLLFSSDAQKQRGRMFNQTDLELVKKIKGLFSDGLSLAEIKVRLNVNETNVQDETLPPSPVKEVAVAPVQAVKSTSLKPSEPLLPLYVDTEPSEKKFQYQTDDKEKTEFQELADSILESIKRLEDIQQRQARQIETLQYDLTQTRAAFNRLKDDQLYQAERYEKHLNTPWWKLLSRKNRI